MAIKRINNYKDSHRDAAFPNEESEKYFDKDKNYYLDVCKSMLYSFTNERGNSLIKYRSSHLKMLERYFNGTQGNTKVKEKLLRRDKRSGAFYGKMKKVFQTYDVLPEMLDVVFSINAKQSYTISSVAVDDVSGKTREVQKNLVKFLLDKRTQYLFEKLEMKMTPNFSEEELTLYTDAEIDLLYDTGGVQLDWEMAAKAACNTISLNSDIKAVENRCTQELIKWGFTATRTYLDKSTNEPKIRNVDIPNLIIPKPKYVDGRDITRFGEIRWISLTELRQICPSLTRDQYVDIIEGALGYTENSYLSDFYTSDEDINGFYDGSNTVLGEIQVPILDAQWLANDVQYRLYYEKYDSEFSKKVSRKTELSRSEKKKGNRIDKKKFIKRYEAVWLIGSDILLEYGEAKSNHYYGKKGNKTPYLDLSFYSTGKKSITERCVPFVEDINLAVVKLRQAIATLPPAPQLVIYKHALRNVVLNGKKQTGEDLVQGLIEDGVLVVNGEDEKGNPIFQNGGKAVDNLNLNVAEQIATYSNQILTNVNMIRQVIGLPEGLDGTSGNPYQGLGKQQLAAAASSNALFPTLSPIGPLFEKAFRIGVGYYQVLSSEKDIELQDISLSETSAKVFNLSKEFSSKDFKIKFTYAPNDEEKQFMLEKMLELERNYAASGGNLGLTTSEYFIISRLIKSDRIEEAIRQLARFEKIRKIEADRRSAMLQEQNASVSRDAGIAVEQEKQKTIQAKGEEDRKTAAVKSGLDSFFNASLEKVKQSAGESGNVDDNAVEEVDDKVMTTLGPVIENMIRKVLQEQEAEAQAQAEQAAQEQAEMQQPMPQ